MCDRWISKQAELDKRLKRQSWRFWSDLALVCGNPSATYILINRVQEVFLQESVRGLQSFRVSRLSDACTAHGLSVFITCLFGTTQLVTHIPSHLVVRRFRFVILERGERPRSMCKTSIIKPITLSSAFLPFSLSECCKEAKEARTSTGPISAHSVRRSQWLSRQCRRSIASICRACVSVQWRST